MVIVPHKSRIRENVGLQRCRIKEVPLYTVSYIHKYKCTHSVRNKEQVVGGLMS